MSKSEKYQKEYKEIEKELNYEPIEDTISSLRLLVEEMLGTIQYLEDFIGRNA